MMLLIQLHVILLKQLKSYMILILNGFIDLVFLQHLMCL